VPASGSLAEDRYSVELLISLTIHGTNKDWGLRNKIKGERLKGKGLRQS